MWARVMPGVRCLMLVGVTYGYSLEMGELFQLASVACLRGVARLLGPAATLLHPACMAATRPDAAAAGRRLGLGAVRVVGV